MRRVVLSACLLALGCKASDPQSEGEGKQASPPAVRTQQQICEHASQRFHGMGRLILLGFTDDSLPEELRATSARIQAAEREPFIQRCLQLEGEQLDCMAEIDVVADLFAAAEKGLSECRARHGEDYVMHCQQWFAAFGEALAKQSRVCQKVFDDFLTELAQIPMPPEGLGAVRRARARPE